MESKRKVRRRCVSAKARSDEFGSPINWTQNKENGLENRKLTSKQTSSETEICDEVDADSVFTSSLRGRRTGTLVSDKCEVNCGGQSLNNWTGGDNDFNIRNIKGRHKMTPLSSDSEDYDTDLEAETIQCKESPKPTGIDETEPYIQACQHWKVTPLPCVTDCLKKKCITLKNKSVGPKTILSICAALKSNRQVERLNLEGVDISEEGIQHLAEVLIHNNYTITHLNISSNSIGLRGAQAIGHVMVVTDNITHLNLSGNKLNDESAWYLTSGINSNTSITHLDISYNELGIESGVLLGSSLARNCTLTWINMCWNKIYGHGAVAIFRGLMVNTSIEHLDISWNGLGYEGSVALSKCLKVNTQLRYLNISNNRIDWRCSLLLAEGLRENVTLSKLKVGFNPLTTTGVMDILEAVATNESSVTYLDCSEVPVIGSADLLAATVGRLRSFTFLHGGIVSTHDKLGERVGHKINPMLRIIEYLRLLGLRPLELLKSFDKSVSFEMPREEFIDQIKKIGVKLHPFEIEALANSVSGKGYNRNVINYRKLSMAVREVADAERRRKIKEREEWKQMKTYQNNILKRGTVNELITSSNAFSESLNPMSSRSNHTITNSIQGSSNTNTLPLVHRHHKTGMTIGSRRLQKRSTKEIIF